jgi:hypothetical protein
MELLSAATVYEYNNKLYPCNPYTTAHSFHVHPLHLGIMNSRSKLSQSFVTTDGQSASLSWCQATIWSPRPDSYYCQTVAGLLMWGALSDGRTGLPFTIVAGPHQRSHS